MKSIEEQITSLRAITTPMLLINIALASLFFSELLIVFNIANEYLNIIASLGIAIGVGWTVLDTSVNSYLMKPFVPIVFAVGTLMLMLIKLQVFVCEGEHYSWYITRIFISVLVAAAEFTFSYLFVKKHEEQKANESQVLTNERLIEANKSLEQAKESQRLAEEELQMYKKALTCKKCGKVHKTVSQHRNCKHEILKSNN